MINPDERDDHPAAAAHGRAIRDAAQVYADAINAARRDGFTVDVDWHDSFRVGWPKPDLIVGTVTLTETAYEG